MKSITIHNLDDKLETEMRKFARMHNTSLNKAIQALLKKSLNIDTDDRIGDFREFLGVWKEQDFKDDIPPLC